MKTFKQVLGYSVTVLVAAFTMVGCGKNSDNNNPNPAVVGPYGYPNCPTCGAYGQPISTATAQNQQLGEVLQLTLFGTTGAQWGQYYNSYGQQVSAQGVLHVGTLASQCGVPPGDYQISAQGQPAVMQGQYIQSLNMIGTGPTQIQIQFTRIFYTGPTAFQADGYFQGPGAYRPCQFNYY